MQTFLPFPDFAQTASSLEWRRLGKQRVETLELLAALAGDSKGWVNHPATRMWRGYEAALIEYGVAICLEWRRRGYRDTCLEKIQAFASRFPASPRPPWLGDPAFHAAHRSNLRRKDPVFYASFDEPPDLPYIWPV